MLFDFTDMQADMDAIDRYIRAQPINNDAARVLKSDWIRWYDGLSWFDKGTESVRQQASNRRNAFNVANAKSDAERETVKQTIATGLTRDEIYNGKRVVDAAGNYPKQPGVTVLSAAKGTVPVGARPTIRRGSQGAPVVAWQKIIGVTADGKFGPQTEAATKKWQLDRGLVADGVVGSATWGAALGGKNAPPMSPAVAAITPVAPATTKGSAVPTGAVAQIPSLTKPRPTIARPEPRPKPKVIAATQQPVKESTDPVINPTQASFLTTFKAMPLMKKVTTVGGTALSIVGAVLLSRKLF